MWVPDPEADELRWRTERFLLGCQEASIDGALRLAREIGALTADEAEGWRVRLPIGLPRGGAHPLPEAARERLESLARELEELGPDGSDSPAWWAIQAQAGVLQLVGLLSREEAHAWDARASHAVGLTSISEHEAEVEAHARAKTRLLDVVAGAPSDGSVQLVEVRRYDGAVEVIHLHREEESRPPPAYELTDDAGTEYAYAGGSGGDDDWQANFRPGVPSGATRLRFAVGDEVVEVALP